MCTTTMTGTFIGQALYFLQSNVRTSKTYFIICFIRNLMCNLRKRLRYWCTPEQCVQLSVESNEPDSVKRVNVGEHKKSLEGLNS